MIEILREVKTAVLRSQKRQRANRVATRGLPEKPRLSVFRSSKHIYAQLIDDQNRKTLVSYSDQELGKESKMTKMVKAEKVGEELAKKAIEAGIKKVVFDRGSFRYHGRVRSVAEGARRSGLVF